MHIQFNAAAVAVVHLHIATAASVSPLFPVFFITQILTRFIGVYVYVRIFITTAPAVAVRSVWLLLIFSFVYKQIK